MICPKCGRNIPDGTTCPCSAGPVLSSNPALNALKSIGASPLFLALAVLFSLSTLLVFISAFVSSTSTDLMDLYYLAHQLDLDPSVLYPMLDMVNGASVVGAILGSIPGILVAVSLWLTYTSSRNTQTGNVSTAGITICKVLTIIQLVFMCIALAFCLLLLFIVIFAAAEGALDDVGYEFGYYFGQYVIVFCVALFIGVIIGFTLAILYQASIIRTCNRVKGTALNGVPDNRVSSYLIVMNYILAVFEAFSAFGFIAERPVSALASLVNAAGLIVLSIVLSRYRSRMTILMYPPVQPVYTQPPVPPQNPWQ